MADHFTETARRALDFSRKAAEEMGVHAIGTEHILLGLIRGKEGLAYEVLKGYGITSEDVSELIRKYLVSNYTVLEFRGFDYTPLANRILATALEKANLYKSSLIGTEHILLSILNYPNCSACKILTNRGVSLEKMHMDIAAMLHSNGAGGRDGSIEKGGQVPGSQKESRTPTLDQYSRDLTQMAEQGNLDPVIGREKEIARLIQILSRRTKNNPCLIGEPGVGKTAVIEGLALRITEGNVPDIMKDKRLISLDLSSMVAGSKYRGEFEERIKNVIREVSQDRNIVLFIDEIHTIIGAGGAEGALDAANIIKPSLARGEIQLIGATTISEYRKHIEKDAALERRFQPVMVEEPSEEETREILLGLKKTYEDHHRVHITDGAISAAVKLSARYIPDRFLPDKAIDLIDEAGSKVRLQTFVQPKELKKLEEEIRVLEKEKEQAIFAQEFETCGEIKKKQQKKRARIEKIRTEWEKNQSEFRPEVTEEEIADIIASWTKIPVSAIREDEAERLKNLEATLHKRVIGQDEAVSAVSRAIRRGRVGLKDPKRPIGSFLFLGPTGVGKTELSKALSETMFGTENAIIRVDMSEYMEKHSVSKMIGSPPGYVGFEEGGQLSEKIRRNPYSVVLFDEIEKAHPDVFNILLQVLDDGQITDAQGRKVNFKNTVIIMTSNCGAENIITPKVLGFGQKKSEGQDYAVMKDRVNEAVKRQFKPEFLNRIDEIIIFHPLNRENMKDIVNIMLRDLSKRARAQMDLRLKFQTTAKELLIEKGYDPKYGARPLRRAIQNLLEDVLAEKILNGEFSAGDTISIGRNKAGLSFTRQTAKADKDPKEEN